MTDADSRISSPDNDEAVRLRQRLTELELLLERQSDRLQAAYREAAQFRRIFEEAADAIFINDDADAILDVNPAVCRMLGYTREELLQLSVSDVVAPEYHLGAGRQVRVELESGAPREGMDLHKDGRRIPVEIRSAPLYVDEAGRTIAVSIVRDMTERLQAEQSLRQSEQRFRTVADFTYAWEYWVGPAGEVMYVSPSCQRITGYEPAEFEASPSLFTDIVHPDHRQQFLHHLQVESSTRDYGHLAYRIRTRQNEDRWIDHVCQPVYDGEGNFLGRRVSSRDVSELKLAEEGLRQAQDDLERQVEERTMQLVAANADLQRFNRLAVGRELRMIELKREVNTLALKLGQPVPYDLSFAEDHPGDETVV